MATLFHAPNCKPDKDAENIFDGQIMVK